MGIGVTTVDTVDKADNPTIFLDDKMNNETVHHVHKVPVCSCHSEIHFKRIKYFDTILYQTKLPRFVILIVILYGERKMLPLMDLSCLGSVV